MNAARPAAPAGGTGAGAENDDGEILVAAPAKINLYLHVLGRRDDGYHVLDSLIAFAALHDTIAVRPAAEISLRVDGPFASFLADRPDNLVLDAARALARAAGVDDGAEIRLIKRLPVAAGIGGGSADAAATLRALVRLWRLAPESLDMAGLALSLGADVPICLAGRAAFVGGIGETIDELPGLPPVPLVLANPGRPLATEEVFATRRGDFSAAGRFAAAPSDAAGLAELLSARRNDLAASAARAVPEIDDVLAALTAAPGCLLARMSGSGATCFALFARAEEAGEAAARVAEARPTWWVRASTLVADACN